MNDNKKYVEAIAKMLEEQGAYKYFEEDDPLDIEWTLDYTMHFRGANVAVTLGGPNVYINTFHGSVDLYWGNEEEHAYLSVRCRDELNDYFEELFNSIDEKEKNQIIVSIKNRMFGEGLMMESITFNDWINNIKALKE